VQGDRQRRHEGTSSECPYSVRDGGAIGDAGFARRLLVRLGYLLSEDSSPRRAMTHGRVAPRPDSHAISLLRGAEMTSDKRSLAGEGVTYLRSARFAPSLLHHCMSTQPADSGGVAFAASRRTQLRLDHVGRGLARRTISSLTYVRPDSTL
jgi:hypothetical protein